ncbi:MAG: ABC transporter ATP-binding protein [Candidatus Binataceae bacterium]
MLLQIKDLRKYFDLGDGRIVHAVDGVTLDVEQGTVVGLVGESGSGKSTLGKTAVGLLDKTAGEVIYRGETLPQRYRPSDFRLRSREIQMIFQDPYGSLDPRMTVREIIAEPLRLAAFVSAREELERVAQWLGRVGLSPDFMGRYAHELSGGQRQRIGIARALIVEPRLVICDEPISALDVSVQAQVVNLLMDLQASMALTLIFIAHDLSMVRHIADRVAVMYLGSLVEDGPTDKLYRNPAHPYTQALIASNPEPDPHRERHRSRSSIRGEIPSAINPPPGCRFALRCPLVMDRCRNEAPQITSTGDNHRVACHLIGEPKRPTLETPL